MKHSTRNKVNLIFSSFLVIGFIICSFFFAQLAKQVGGTVGCMIQALILVLFGALLFYATRVGEGRQVKRFSLAVLLLLVLPCVYIVAASFWPALPLHDQLAPVTAIAEEGKSAFFPPVILMLACIGLGYGIPYTFLSGYELDTDDDAPAEDVEEAAEAPAEEAEKSEETAEAPAEETEKSEETAEAPAEEAEKTEEAAEAPAEEAEKTEEDAEAPAEAEKTDEAEEKTEDKTEEQNEDKTEE